MTDRMCVRLNYVQNATEGCRSIVGERKNFLQFKLTVREDQN